VAFAPLAVTALAALVAALTARATWQALSPARLLGRGQYTEAREAAQRLERSLIRVFPSIRRSARWARGCALHLEGDLEGSLEALAALHREKVSGPLRYALCSLDAASLVLLGRDLERAKALLAEAGRTRRPPEDLLLGAFVERGLGHPEEAASLFALAGAPRRAESSHETAIFHALRGLYLQTGDDPSAGHRDLEIAAESPFANVYTMRARAALEARDGEDGPSSLSPQVVAVAAQGSRAPIS
jgi:hypothetical protein